jgi:cytoskeletal protein CcmA (bactofilin family)
MAFWNKQEHEASGVASVLPSVTTARSEARHEEGNHMAMLKRDELTPSAGGSGDLLLGQGAEFEGKLTFAGTVRIDAKFKGSIVTNDVLVVGEHARMEADITCGTVIVYGEVIGNIKAKTAIELHHPAKVRGDVETPTLSIEKGVVFQGQSTMPTAERNVVVKPANGVRDAATGASPAL